MLTPSVTPLPPSSHLAKKTISDADAGEMRQGSEPAGFGKLLARELSNKSDGSDMSRAKSADKNTEAQDGDAKRMTASESAEDVNASVNGREDAPSSKDPKKSGSASADSASPQFMELANMLPALVTGQPVPVTGEIPAGVQAYVHEKHRSDAQSIDIQGYGQLTDEAGEVSRIQRKNRMEQEGTTTAYATLANQSLSLIPGNIDGAVTGVRPDSTVIQKGARQLAGISAHVSAAVTTDLTAGVAAGLSSGVMGDVVQNEATGTARPTSLQSDLAIRFAADAGQDGSKRQELSLMEGSLGGELGKFPNTSAEAAPQNFSAIQTEPALSTFAIERGLAPTSTASASSLDHSLSTLEPRLGSAGWDSALGQKIVWMTSQQQHVAELSLNPPDLGPLQIVLTVNNDQASAVFVSHNPDVRQALEAALPRLKEMMADGGISLGNTTISSDSSQQGALMEGFERRNHSGAHHAGDGGRTNTGGSDRAGIAGISIRGLVDTFA